MSARSIATDGASNRLRFLALTNGGHLWQLAQTVEPVRAPVTRCREIISDARSQAQMEQDRAPLIPSRRVR